MSRDLLSRLAAKTRVLPDGCHVWTGFKNQYGYGRIGLADASKLSVHRVAYEQRIGPIPDGMTVDHICFTRACVNPLHLQLATHRENAARQRRALSNQCARGHLMVGRNLRVRSNGRRVCKECVRLMQRAADAKKRRKI